MPKSRPSSDLALIEQEILGYLNFSAGASDPKFLASLSALYGSIEEEGAQRNDSLRLASEQLSARLRTLHTAGGAFADPQQAKSVLAIAFGDLPAAYRAFHHDLLHHQPDSALWRPFFVGRACEAVLRQGSPWDETARIVAGAIETLNDYIGYRPVAVLRTTQRLEPYDHEWVRPIPLFVRGAGVAVGRYQQLILRALELLEHTEPGILAEAYFDLALLDELALDPRAYDFDHPANKRPNYHFGGWDPHHLDNQGRYRRFVLQQPPLDGLLARIDQAAGPQRDELLLEGAAVLAGIILMASGTSGSTPQTHDSTMSLAKLLPKIAAYRDAFYQDLVRKLPGAHGERLRADAERGRQPFVHARQYLNQHMARCRATQIEQVHIALIFARMGYTAAALSKAQSVSVPSARMRCEIECRITAGHLAIDAGQIPLAAAQLPQVENFLNRAVEVGALVDPWNILGFQGQFSLFPALENTVPDHRVEQLVTLLDQVFGLYSRVSSEAAARNDEDLQTKVASSMERLARWWDQFAATTVESVEAFSGHEAYESASQVSQALRAWHQAGAAAGDIAFWRKHAAQFESPKSYALVVEALLEKRDHVAAMALLMQWLSQAGDVRLQQSEYSFHRLARRWLDEVCSAPVAGKVAPTASGPAALIVKFFDFLEANAEDLWEVPRVTQPGSRSRDRSESDPADEEDQQVFAAAYDDMVYVDSTSDGFEGEVLDSEGAVTTDFELETQSRTIRQHLAFLTTVAHLWKRVALWCRPDCDAHDTRELSARWCDRASSNFVQLLELIDDVNARRVPAPTASRESTLEYDRRRSVKDALLESAMTCAVATAEAHKYMAIVANRTDGTDAAGDHIPLLEAALAGDASGVRESWADFIAWMKSHTLLYVSPSRGGNPRQVVEARHMQRTIRDLLQWLPRLGLLRETCELLHTARMMEIEHPVGPGAVSELDQLFETGNQALVEALETVSRQWASRPSGDDNDSQLVECLEQLTQALLSEWLAHSRTLRLSVIERIIDSDAWQSLVTFIEFYGEDLFTQRFLNQSNLRGILHQGVEAWLSKTEDDPEAVEQHRLIADLEAKRIDRAEAVKQLTIVFEAVVENYPEYRDYNNTTTQSDRGQLLYTLLDFLRLRLQYDRIAWHLRPVVAAHEVLVRRGRSEAAEMWRRALAERTAEIADSLLSQYDALQVKYGMRLPTVADRLKEKFVRPLFVDRIKAAIEPAMREARQGGPSAVFQVLEQEIEELSQEPTGIGLDAPRWIVELEQEVERADRRLRDLAHASDLGRRLPQVPLTFEEVQFELNAMEQQ